MKNSKLMLMAALAMSMPMAHSINRDDEHDDYPETGHGINKPSQKKRDSHQNNKAIARRLKQIKRGIIKEN